MNRPHASKLLNRQQETLVKSLTVDGDRIDLILVVDAANVSAGAPAVAGEVDGNHGVTTRRPFALNPEEAGLGREDQVVAGVLAEGLRDIDAELGRRSRDRQLGHVALVVRGPTRRHAGTLACPAAPNKT